MELPWKLQAKNIGRTCSAHVLHLLSYCGLIDAKIRASDKDLPAHVASIELFIFRPLIFFENSEAIRKAGWDLISLSKRLVHWTTCTILVLYNQACYYNITQFMLYCASDFTWYATHNFSIWHFWPGMGWKQKSNSRLDTGPTEHRVPLASSIFGSDGS